MTRSGSKGISQSTATAGRRTTPLTRKSKLLETLAEIKKTRTAGDGQWLRAKSLTVA
jgi:hypothetical protein